MFSGNNAGASRHDVTARVPLEQFHALNALRGVCALLVACFHFHILGAIYGLQIVQSGWMFVDFFFILSGFVVSHAYARRLAQGDVTVGRFMLLRMGRVYPLHLFVLMLLVALEAVRLLGIGGRPAFDQAHSVSAIFTNILLLQSMNVHDENTWNGVSWSIAAEIWACLAFAISFAIWPRRGLMLMGIVGTISLLVLWRFSPSGLDATYDLGTWRAILGFAIGLALHVAYSAGVRIAGTLAEIVAVIAPLVFISRVHTGPATFLTLPLFGFAVLVFAAQAGYVSRLLSARIPMFLGTISYSIYMTHGLVQLIAFELIKRFGAPYGFVFGVGAEGDDVAAPLILGDLLVLATLGGIVLLSAITYRYVELPARNWVRGFRLGRRAPMKVS